MRALTYLIAGFAWAQFHAWAAPLGTVFTYQGRLADNGAAAHGSYSLRFILYNAEIGGNQVGPTLTNENVSVSAGLFTTSLDFGAAALDGSARWLEVGVRTNGSASVHQPLGPRQPLTPTPYAFYSANASVAQNVTGTVSSAVSFNNPSNSFTGNGAGLSGVNAGTLNGLASSNFWRTTGNAGTTAGTHFLGTTDNQPLELKVNGLRALRVEFGGDSNDADSEPDGAPNVIWGAPINFVGPGVVGATISGGGMTNFGNSNSVLSDFGVVGGGAFNNIADRSSAAIIAGGTGNFIGANSDFGAISGGAGNYIFTNSPYVTIAGGVANSIGNSTYSAIGGGRENYIANSFAATIAGGFANRITNSLSSAIGGGAGNNIGTNSSHGVIGGGEGNRIAADSFNASIIGGRFNGIGTNSHFSAIGGGQFNAIAPNSPSATIPGGENNSATNFAFAAGRRAKANHTGAFVWADSTDADFASTGTNQFLIRANGGVGIGTTAPEGDLHVFRGSAGAVTASVGAPLVVESDTNTFIHMLTPGNALSGILFGSPLGFADASIRYNNSGGDRELSFRTLNNQKMVITTNGNVGIGTNSPTNRLHVNGGITCTALTQTSDRNAKENFAPVSPREVLDKVAALPITTWNFKELHDGRHIGPMAQDFHAAFGLGNSDTTITSVDPDGVALAAIQGLNRKLEEEIKRRDSENADLKRRNESLEHRLEVLENIIRNPNSN